MKKALLTLTVAMLPVSTGIAAGYTIDPAHTYPNFQISHLGFSTMFGRFGSTSGTMTFDPAARTASVNITIDASSIDTGHKKRDEHLRSPDFLNVAEFPNIEFKSTSVTWNGSQPATVSGNLTIMGVSKPVTLQVTSMKCGEHPFNKKPLCGFDATANIKRTDFGVNYGIPAIGDEMQLNFEVEAYRDQ